MPRKRFRRLGLFYAIALSGIALSIIISQILIQNHIRTQEGDAHVINVAGRQRMLSQKISKLVLQMASQEDPGVYLPDLQEALALWKRSHVGLLVGDSALELGGRNSATILNQFEEIRPHFNIIVSNAQSLIDLVESRKSVTQAQIAPMVRAILDHEGPYLEGMNRIVFQYDREAQFKIDNLREIEIWLFVISLVIILLELLFIFRPLAKSVKATVAELVESEKSSKNMTTEMSKLYEELVKSYQDLEAVNLQPSSPTVLANMDPEGRFIDISSTFRRLMEFEASEMPTNFVELLERSGYKEYFISGVLRLVQSGQKWSGELKMINGSGDFCWIEVFLIPIGDGQEVKLIGQDITELKEAKMRSQEINRERIEKKVKEQNYRSVLILEGQEEERKRLSRELHDGVGQMLSAMKLSLESISPSNAEHMRIRLRDALSLMKSIIQEVRRVSFNLTPSSLDDFGLVPAVKKFCEEINSVTKVDVHFVNETRFINRLESRIETNLYRIIQEAVNNALKYAKATNITVTFSHTINNLNISIEDNGKGFDFERLKESGHFEKAGHGIFNMKERTAFIGGVFKLDTEIGKGTRILLTLSLD